MPARMTYIRTRSGLSPAVVPERPSRYILPIRWYVPAVRSGRERLRFGDRFAFNLYLNRTAP